MTGECGAGDVNSRRRHWLEVRPWGKSQAAPGAVRCWTGLVTVDGRAVKRHRAIGRLGEAKGGHWAVWCPGGRQPKSPDVVAMERRLAGGTVRALRHHPCQYSLSRSNTITSRRSRRPDSPDPRSTRPTSRNMTFGNTTQHNSWGPWNPPTITEAVRRPSHRTHRPRPSMCQKAGCCREKPRAAGRHLEHVVPERDANATVRRKILGRLIQLKKSSHSERALLQRERKDSGRVIGGHARRFAPSPRIAAGKAAGRHLGLPPFQAGPFFSQQGSRLDGWGAGPSPPSSHHTVLGWAVPRRPSWGGKEWRGHEPDGHGSRLGSLCRTRWIRPHLPMHNPTPRRPSHPSAAVQNAAADAAHAHANAARPPARSHI